MIHFDYAVWLYILSTVSALSLIGIAGLYISLKRKTEQLDQAAVRRMDEAKSDRNRIERIILDETSRQRVEAAETARHTREELSGISRASLDSLLKRIGEHAVVEQERLAAFSNQLHHLTRLNEEKLESIRNSVQKQLTDLRQENSRKLDQMRLIVDETLQNTLQKRLGESFAQVSAKLEQVYKGLGEMRHLAVGVGDLKKVLTNVKTRGIWGEMSLGHIIEQILSPEQYATNIETRKNSGERVEFAVKLPGPKSDRSRTIWLPIDAKFPQEDYQRLLDAQEAANKALAEKCTKSLETRIKAEARRIRDKYIDPPNTTDFGILFLPVEGLYAEVVRCAGLCDFLQREYRIVITGPTTLAALLNSLQMGFRTLAIEERSGEVWELLERVKTEFGNFGAILSKTRQKLKEASDTIDQAEVRTRAIERRLRKVETLN